MNRGSISNDRLCVLQRKRCVPTRRGTQPSGCSPQLSLALSRCASRKAPDCFPWEGRAGVPPAPDGIPARAFALAGQARRPPYVGPLQFMVPKYAPMRKRALRKARKKLLDETVPRSLICTR